MNYPHVELYVDANERSEDEKYVESIRAKGGDF